MPPHLKTKTALRDAGLRPGGPAVATVRYRRPEWRRGEYAEAELFDEGVAVPKRAATPAQLAALEKASEAKAANEARRRREADERRAARLGEMKDTLGRILSTTRTRAHERLLEWAATPGAVVLDVETTDLYGEVVEAAVVTLSGEVLLDTLVRPSVPVEEGARAVHGITDDMLATAPGWPEVWGRLQQVLAGRTVLAWNAEFDVDAVARSNAAHDLSRRDAYGLIRSLPEGFRDGVLCAMRAYAPLIGEWRSRGGSWRWPSLDAAIALEDVDVRDLTRHRALGDALAVARVVRAAAARPAPEPWTPEEIPDEWVSGGRS